MGKQKFTVMVSGGKPKEYRQFSVTALTSGMSAEELRKCIIELMADFEAKAILKGKPSFIISVGRDR